MEGKGSKPRVWIAVPVVGGWIWCELAIRLIEWSHDPTVVLNINHYPNESPVDSVRNHMVKDFREADPPWDYLCMIDHDIVPPRGALRELIRAEKDVIQALCFTHKMIEGKFTPLPVAFRLDEDQDCVRRGTFVEWVPGAGKGKEKRKKFVPYWGSGIERTDMVGGGCVLIKRHVVEKFREGGYFGFRYDENGIRRRGEDIGFSEICRDAGLELYTHYGIWCKHFTITDIKSNYEALMKWMEVSDERREEFESGVSARGR